MVSGSLALEFLVILLKTIFGFLAKDELTQVGIYGISEYLRSEAKQVSRHNRLARRSCWPLGAKREKGRLAAKPDREAGRGCIQRIQILKKQFRMMVALSDYS